MLRILVVVLFVMQCNGGGKKYEKLINDISGKKVIEIVPVEVCTQEVREAVKNTNGTRRIEMVPVQVCMQEVREVIKPASSIYKKESAVVPVQVCTQEVREVVKHIDSNTRDIVTVPVQVCTQEVRQVINPKRLFKKYYPEENLLS